MVCLKKPFPEHMVFLLLNWTSYGVKSKGTRNTWSLTLYFNWISIVLVVQKHGLCALVNCKKLRANMVLIHRPFPVKGELARMQSLENVIWCFCYQFFHTNFLHQFNDDISIHGFCFSHAFISILIMVKTKFRLHYMHSVECWH